MQVETPNSRPNFRRVILLTTLAAFVAMVAAAGLKVLAWLIYLFSGNSGYYGYGYSDGAATAIAWIGFFALLGLLAQVIVLLVGWLQQRV